MKSINDLISESINEEMQMKYSFTAFERMMLITALEHFIDTKGYEKDKSKGSSYTKKQVEKVMDKVMKEYSM